MVTLYGVFRKEPFEDTPYGTLIQKAAGPALFHHRADAVEWALLMQELHGHDYTYYVGTIRAQPNGISLLLDSAQYLA